MPFYVHLSKWGTQWQQTFHHSTVNMICMASLPSVESGNNKSSNIWQGIWFPAWHCVQFQFALLVMFDEHINFWFLVTEQQISQVCVAIKCSTLCWYPCWHLYTHYKSTDNVCRNLCKKLDHSTLTVTFMQCLMDTFWFSWYWTFVSSWRRHCLPFNS